MTRYKTEMAWFSHLSPARKRSWSNFLQPQSPHGVVVVSGIFCS